MVLWYTGQVTNIYYINYYISVSGASKLCFLLPQRRFHSIYGYSTCGVFWNKLEVFLKPKNILPKWLVREHSSNSHYLPIFHGEQLFHFLFPVTPACTFWWIRCTSCWWAKVLWLSSAGFQWGVSQKLS